jgi:hypothetical protein
MEFIIRTSSNGGTGGAAFGFDVAWRHGGPVGLADRAQ